MRGEGVFDARAGRPAEPQIDVLFIVADSGRVDEALAGPGQPAGGVSEPISIGVADAAACGADIIPLLGDVGARAGDRGHHRIRVQIIRKRDVGFDAEQEAGGKPRIVAGLHAADEAAEHIAGCSDGGIREHGIRRTAAVAGMRADIEAGPVVYGSIGRRLERHVRRSRRGAERERAEGNAGQKTLLRSAVAVHDANISSADAAKDLRTITADLPTRRHPRNAVINPAAPGRIPRSRSRLDRETARFIPNPYCK